LEKDIDAPLFLFLSLAEQTPYRLQLSSLAAAENSVKMFSKFEIQIYIKYIF
jgi:hypothetical protein